MTFNEQHVTIERFLASGAMRDVIDNYYEFTFVRNPYDRLYSGFS